MQNSFERELLKSDLFLPWVIVGLMLVTLMAAVVVCQSMGAQIQHPLAEDARELIRAVLYIIAIVTFPMTNLIRYIQLRLNQTMPGSKPAKSRYLLTVIVSLSLIESVGLFGLVMFVLGDDFNTLYIFTGLSALGLYLYRPKQAEYDEIVAAIASQQKH